MKRLVLSFFIVILSVQTNFSQFKFGVKLGLTATNVNMDAASNFNDLELPTARTLNFDGGIVFEYELMPEILSIRSGLGYAQKGFNVDLNQVKQKFNDIKEITGDWQTRFQYLQFPVNFVYHFGDFNINAGPYLAYGLGGTEIQDLKIVLNDNTVQNLQETYDLKAVFGSVNDDLSSTSNSLMIQYFNGLDYGINVGFGFNIKQVLINIQYQQGFTNITPDLVNEPNFSPSDLLAKHNVLSLEVTYFFKK